MAKTYIFDRYVKKNDDLVGGHTESAKMFANVFYMDGKPDVWIV